MRALRVPVAAAITTSVIFGFFARSVAVANIARFAGRLAAEPRFLTSRESGAGFAELVDHLLG